MDEITGVPLQYGTCIRCGWPVSRRPDGKWAGMLGGDCRSGDGLAEDGVHLVLEIRERD